jgi:hypothetical protein
MTRLLLAVMLLLAFVPAVAAPEDDHKVEAIGALTEPSVAEAVRGALEAKGWRVLAGGKRVGEVWLRREIATGRADIPGALFGQIPEGTLIGVIHFAAAATDFRGQAIKPGYYTLRYALILNDGNHLGVSESRDFVLLAPVAQDKDPAAQMKVEDLVKLSRLASGSSHPSPWFLAPATSSDGLPKVIKTEHEHIILEFKLNTKSGPLAIGLTLIGQTEG